MSSNNSEGNKSVENWQLKRCDNPWKPNVYNGQSEVYRRILGILNRLTKQTAHVLLQQSLELPITDPEHLPDIISLLLIKVQDEPLFTSVYADFCSELSLRLNIQENISSACEAHFSESLQRLTEFDDSAPESQSMETIQKEILERKRLTVHISFVCALVEKNLVTADHLVWMAEVLLRHGDLRSIECLCRLLSFAGETLARTRPDVVDSSMSVIRSRSTSSVVPSRLKFILMDTIELETNGWRPRRGQNSVFSRRNVRG